MKLGQLALWRNSLGSETRQEHGYAPSVLCDGDELTPFLRGLTKNSKVSSLEVSVCCSLTLRVGPENVRLGESGYDTLQSNEEPVEYECRKNRGPVAMPHRNIVPRCTISCSRHSSSCSRHSSLGDGQNAR